MQHLMRYLCIQSILFSLLGCQSFSTQDAAPVVDISSYKTITSGHHIVQRGESLYEIAWRYGRDYREIALANHISPPYIIHPGQKLSLKEVSRNSTRISSDHHPRATLAKQTVSDLERKRVAKTARVSDTTQDSTSFNHKWRWPVSGKIIKHYASGSGIKGIDIAGHIGKQVKSAAPGKVVYSGSGLRGYGQLIIIKHSDTYLSAYGHNSRLLVKEGDPVKDGQVIAEMGQSDTDRVKLHFEIRKNGQPIDPLSVLPSP